MPRTPILRPWGLALLIALVAAATSVALAGSSAETVTLKADDGVAIVGTYYRPARPGPRPAVILLHMLSRTRRDWNTFALRLAREGYAALAIDLRGHGASTRGVGSWRAFSPEDFHAMVKDVAAAHAFLRSAAEADATKLAVIGASIGANVALLYGSREPSVGSVVLLSPGLDYRGVATAQAMRAYGPRPVLIAASREDSYSAESSSALDALAQGRHKLVLYSDAGHGTRMFDKVPELESTLLSWLASTL